MLCFSLSLGFNLYSSIAQMNSFMLLDDAANNQSLSLGTFVSTYRGGEWSMGVRKTLSLMLCVMLLFSSVAKK